MPFVGVRLGIPGASLGGGAKPTFAGLSLNSTVTIVGDSFAANGGGSNTVFGNQTNHFNDNGYWTMALAQGGALAMMPLGGNLGLPGQLAITIAAQSTDTQIAVANTLNSAAVILLAGTNDLSGSVSAATISAALDTIIQTLTSQRIYLGTIIKRFSPNALTGAQEIQRGLLNALILAKASSRVKVFDADSVVTDATFLLADGLHPNTKGSKVIGAILGSVMLADSLQPLTAFDTMVATALKNPNPGFAGTGGGAINGATGVCATGYRINAQNVVTSGVAVVGSKDGVTGNQIVTLSGSFTSAGNQAFVVEASPPPGIAGLVTGDIIEMDAVFKISSNLSSNIQTPLVQYQVFPSDFSQVISSGIAMVTSGTPFNQMVSADGTFRLRTPPIAIGPGSPPVAPSAIVMQLVLTINSGTAVATSGAIELIQMGVRKLN